MRKITVRDSEKSFHTYRSDTDDLQFFVNDLGVEIVKWSAGADGERQQARVGHFARGFYMWAKEGDAEASPKAQQPAFNGKVTFPPDTKFNDDGSITVGSKPPIDSDPFTAAALAKDSAPPKPDFETLRRPGKINTAGRAAEPAKVSAAQAAPPKPGDDAATVQAQYDAMAKAEKPKKKRIRNRKKAGTSKALDEALATIAKPDFGKTAPDAIKTTFPPTPVMAIAGDGTATPLDDADLARLEGADVDIYPDPAQVIGEAEARHAAGYKPKCATCNDTGTVPDPDSADPLDTKICPDC